jgi:2',3'-cyclic-nucleotide 2'-phosphodiesterase (5'-nucleotidase family)
VYLTRVYREESELANLITDLIGAALPCDFVLVNSGGFRSTWLPGVLQFQHFYNMFPFSNQLVSFEMNGYELIESLKVLQAGRKGFYPVRGLKQVVSLSLNGTARFVSATWANGQPIDLARNYRGVTINFLLEGGDDFKDVMGKVYTLRKEKVEGEMRTIMKPKLIERAVIKEGSLIDPLSPRITVLKV